jgi:hypothetical protein
MFETVLTYRNNWFQTQTGLITVDSKIIPGLINKVDRINAVWTELGYVGNKFGFYGGIRPYVVSGSGHASIPTSVDFAGNIQYTNTSIQIANPVTGYIRAVYADSITSAVKYKISGMVLDNGQYRIQSEFKYQF